MKWNIKRASSICWEKEGYECGRLEGIACMRCMVVKDFLHDLCDFKMDQMAHESMEDYVSFLIRVANMGSESNGGCRIICVEVPRYILYF